eukprot:XP_001692877.1 flagellar associated protein [Chlamydomonas reinhardtii]
MDGNFVADVRLDDSDEVLQLPIVKSKVKKLLQGAVKKIALLGAPVIPSSDDSLEQFLQSAGRFFGKDPAKWDQVGETKVDVVEEAGKRTTKLTGVFTGTELALMVENPYYDERLPAREDKPELNFSQKRTPIRTDDEWQELIAEQPWTASKRRQLLTAYLHAKVEAEEPVLATEGAQGFWELAINKDHHADFRLDRLAALLNRLSSPSLEVATTTAAAIWGLATTGLSRKNLADLDIVSLLLSNIKRSFKMPAQRNKYQSFLLGALSVLLIDRNCRRAYLQQEPEFGTLFVLARNLDGLIASGALRNVISLLNPKGPGENMIQFCAASLLATLVLDDDAMELIRDRGEAPLMFEACIVLLQSTLGKLKREVQRFYGQLTPEEAASTPPFDVELGVRLGEAASQAMWGSAHYCVMMDPIQVKMDHIQQLGVMGNDCYTTVALPLSRIAHCITASLATLAANPDAALLIMTSPNDVALVFLMSMLDCVETENFEQAGHVKASACAGVAFLACHPIGAEGDECMFGPFRQKLLGLGAFGALLRAALSSVLESDCDRIIQQAAAIGLMYLSTMAGAVDAAELAMYAALLTDSDNSEMIEFLMAGMWILLRDGNNRKVLGTSFNPSPANALAKNMINKLNDAITLHEINDEGEEQLERDPDEAFAMPPDTNMPDGEKFYENKDTAFPSPMLMKREESADRLEKRFDKQLKDNWGLETLVSVGESWLPAMLEQDEVGEATDVPVLKLFEFLVASICMFMVDDDGVPERRELDVFRLSAPEGARNKTWWTVDVRAPEADGTVDSDTERALRILLQILGMHLSAAWKSMQLGVLTLWNACCRHPNMERHVVERGVALKLLMVVNNPMWPPSLREISAGCLEFFQERWSNLATFGAGATLLPGGLPAEVSGVSAGGVPPEGVVPYIAAMVGLVNTGVPLMEYRGCHGLARMTYTAPYACPEPKPFLKEAKAVAAALGGVEALVALMKRLNRRYQDLNRGPTGQGEEPENPAMFERDMQNLEAVQDIYFVCMAALLNLSVLRGNQVPIAKRGLLVLLGTNTVFYNRVVVLRANLNATRPGGAHAPSAADALAREEQLLHLCSAIIQNIAQHPQNRTRMYKAELKGSVALDKVIEAATDVDEETRTAASFLPTIPSTRSMSPSANAKMTQNGQVINGGVDTALAGSVRPKVVFPPICERGAGGDAITLQRYGPGGAGSPGVMRMGSQHSGRSEWSGLSAGANVPFSKKGGADDRSLASGSGRTYRKALWDEHGDWLPNEPESAKALNKLLARPMSHLWQDMPEHRARQGRQRWEPTVSEYRELQGAKPLTRPAAKLLSTLPPRDQEDLMVAASQMIGLMPEDYDSDEDEPSTAAKADAVPLKVCLGPKRPRQIITFEDRIVIDNDNRPTLTLFEHVEGSRVSDGLFPSYILPNGKRAHMYYNGGTLLDEALQQTMPLANVLNLIAKPPGSAPPFIPYKPVPRLVPLPPEHTLTVKRPDIHAAEAFGDLREDNLQLVIQAKKIIKTQTTTRVENIEVKQQEEREPWTLPSSIFKNRVKECDARAFFDSHTVEEKMFERDWQRACAKEKFTSMMSRENKANKEGKDEKVAIKEVHDVLLKYWPQVVGAFVYYATGGSSDPYHMSLNAFTTFLDECCIADSESQYCKRSDCDTVFIVCNFQPDKKSAEAQVNMENAMMRYEFLEAIVRLAISKYGKGQATDDLPTAVTMLLEKNIIPNLVPGAVIQSNTFRSERLYHEEVDLVFKKHSVLLKALYSRYRLKPVGGGLRPKVLKLDGWQQFMNDASLVDSQFTLQDASLAYLWARMYTIDEIKDYARYTCLSFTDFLEALGRVADMKALPAASDLDLAGAGFSAPKTRPLYVKLEMFLDLVFRRLYWDPSQPEVPFNYDGLLKLVKKIDKELGP